MFRLWLVWRYLRAGRRFVGLTSLLSLMGMMIGVASLVVAMAVVSGFETTLKRSVIDIVGHVLLIKRGSIISNPERLRQQVKDLVPSLVATTPFFQMEAVIAHKGQLSGVVVEGLDPETVDQVLNIQPRIVAGGYEWKDDQDMAMIGKGLAEKYQLKIGDTFKIVLPRPSKLNTTVFRTRLADLTVGGIVDLGKYEYDERYVLTHIKTVQKLAGTEKGVSGLRLRLNDDDVASQVSQKLSTELGFPYWTKDWKMVNHNLFQAIALERVVIFLVIMVMVIAAAFNISSTLYVSVVRRFSDMSVLQALGLRKKSIVQIFSLQGVVIGLVGSLGGLFLGLLLCYGFEWVEQRWELLPAEVYKLSHFGFELRIIDLLIIFSTSFLICFLASLAPAFRGARLRPVEGIRYE